MTDKTSSIPRTATPAQIAEWIKYHCKDANGKIKCGVTFLVGAGFSASTGIPTAGKMVEEKLKKHPLLNNAGSPGAGQSEYAFLMSKLPPAERMTIIRDAIKKAEDPATKHLKINWAHLLLATMVDAGYINQILTTNFDPLIVEALAVTGQSVRAFDLTASVGFQSGALEDSSVIYLHGQAHGLWLANSPDEMSRVQRHLNSVFQDALDQSILIVVGYSGECDPVFDELIERFPQFRHRLYWVHHSNNEPCKDVLSLLADYYREAYLVKDFDADAFMRELVLEGLQLDLPAIVKTPLQAISSSLQRIMPFPIKSDKPAASDPVKIARESLSSLVQPESSKTDHKSPSPEIEITPLSVEISLAGITKNVQKLKELREGVEKSGDTKLKYALGDAWLNLAINYLDKDDFTAAFESLKIVDAVGSSEPHWQATLWGTALSDQAKTKSGAQADDLFKQAGEKFEQALKIKPDMHAALHNWGNALLVQAKTKSGAQADDLFKQAGEKYQQALKIKPDSCDVIFNSACFFALTNEVEKSIQHLRNWKKCDSAASRMKIDKDSDFNKIREHPKFLEFLKEFADQK